MVEVMGHRRTVRLLEPFTWEDPATGWVWTVPAGFELDGASVPGLARAVTPTFLQLLAGAAFHDLLYRFYDVLGVERQEADEIVGRAWLEDGVDPEWCRIMVNVLRVYGGESWDNWRMSAIDKGPEPELPTHRKKET